MHKKITLIFASALLALATFSTSCQPPALEPALAMEEVRNLTPAIITVSVDPAVKSVLDQTKEKEIKTMLFVYEKVNDRSQWTSTYVSGSNKAETILLGGYKYNLHVLVNMGNPLSDIPRNDDGSLNWEEFAYRIPSYSQLSSAGFPMVGESTFKVDQSASIRFTLYVKMLMAKVTVTVDHSGITGGQDGVGISNTAVYMRGVSNTIRPFAQVDQRKARSAAEIFTGVTDWGTFSSSKSMDNESETLVFYVPENCQGQLLSTNMQWLKSADYMDDEVSALCTFIEYTADKKGEDDGVSGGLTYRCYLGGNTTNDFSVKRSTLYKARLSLSWDGLFEGSTWRIDADDIVDSRCLVLSASQGSLTGVSGNSLGKLNRNVWYNVFVNFSRDEGESWVGDAKDVAQWPYGWELFIDGVKQESTASGTSAGNIDWAYTSSSSGDKLAIRPGASSVFGSTHTIQVKSADGQLESNIVSFEVTQPLRASWSAVPGYIAQQGNLSALDGVGSGLTYSFSVTEGTDVLRLTGAAGNGVTVQTLRPGTATIKMTASNGQEGEAQITVSSPKIKLNESSFQLWVDGTPSVTVFDYVAQDGTTAMSVADTDAEGTGTKFSPSLYEECLSPTLTTPQAFAPYLAISSDRKLYVKTLQESSTKKISSLFGTSVWTTIIHGNARTSAGKQLKTDVGFSIKDPFESVDCTGCDLSFHDVTTMESHLSDQQKAAFQAKQSYNVISSSSARIYADPDNLQVRTSSAIGTTAECIQMSYSTSSPRRVQFYYSGNPTSEHSSGSKPLYIHVQNVHDVAAGGARARYSLSKSVGTARIYFHVAWATFVDAAQYSIPSSYNGKYKKENTGDNIEVRMMWGGFLYHASVVQNAQAAKLPQTMSSGLSGAFFSTARTNGQGFGTGGALVDPYGFLENNGSMIGGSVYGIAGMKGIGHSVICTYRAANALHGTMTWAQWKSYVPYTSPFCTHKSTYSATTVSWTSSNLEGWYYTPSGCEKDTNGNGYVILHFLQDLPVNSNNGYVENGSMY